MTDILVLFYYSIDSFLNIYQSFSHKKQKRKQTKLREIKNDTTKNIPTSTKIYVFRATLLNVEAINLILNGWLVKIES